MLRLLKNLAVLTCATLVIHAQLASDDFNDNERNRLKWAGGGGLYDGRLNEVNQRLEYVAAETPQTPLDECYWATEMPIDANWEAIVSVFIPRSATEPNAISAGIIVPTSGGDVLFIEFYGGRIRTVLGDASTFADRVGPYFDGTTFESHVFGQASSGMLDSTAVLLKMSFLAGQKVIVTSYDRDGAGNLFGWQELGRFGLAGVGGTTANRTWEFQGQHRPFLGLMAISRDTRVESGDVWFDDFIFNLNPPDLQPIPNVIATATSELASHGRLAANTVNGLRCDNSFWESAGIAFGATDDRDPAITFDLRAAYSLTRFDIWNSHEHDPAIKRMLVEISNDGVNFTSLGERSLISGVCDRSESVSLAGVVARYIRFDVLENWNGIVFPVVGQATGWPFVGIDEIEFFGTLAAAPAITEEPQPRTILVGATAQFSVAATGTAPFSYRWRKGGEYLADNANISGSATATLTISNAQSADAGEYDVIVSNAVSSATSARALLTVNVPDVAPAFSAHPQPITVAAGARAEFRATVTGVPAPSLRWQRSTDNGANWLDLENEPGFSGISSSALTIAAASETMNHHRFRLAALNAAGSAQSDAAILTVESQEVGGRLFGVTATATSELPPRIAAHALDGVYCDHEFWESAGIGFIAVEDRDPAITFDLGALKRLSHFLIWNGHEEDAAIKRMDVQISNDGINFTSIGERSLLHINETWDCPIPQTVSLANAVARYIRLDFLENWDNVIFPIVGAPTGWPFVSIDEIEFYGLPGGPLIQLSAPQAIAAGWRINFTTDQAGTYSLWKSTEPAAGWSRGESITVSAGANFFEISVGPAASQFFTIEKN